VKPAFSITGLKKFALTSAKAKEKYNSSPETVFAALSLKNLNGAFIILGIGYVAVFFVFIGEQIMFRWMRKQEIGKQQQD